MTEQPSDRSSDNLFDRLSSLIGGLEETPLLPGQYFTKAVAVSDPGEIQIRYRMIRDAVRDYKRFAFSRSAKRAQHFREVADWFTMTDYDWPYSFENIADVFGLDTSAVRASLTRWRIREIRRRNVTKQAPKEDTASAGPERRPGALPEGWPDEVEERTPGWSEELAEAVSF